MDMTDDTEPCPPPSDPHNCMAGVIDIADRRLRAAQEHLVTLLNEVTRLFVQCPSCEEVFREGPDICPFCGRHLP